MEVIVVSGSNRKNSQSERISKIIQEVSTEKLNIIPKLYSLYTNDLPLWDEEGYGENDKKIINLKKEFTQSNAFIFVVPEWHGMVPPHVKNMILLLGSKPLWHKPALIVTISSSNGGAYPVMELRGSSHKNSHICWIPEQVVIRNVKNWNAKSEDEIFNRLISYLETLYIYAKNMEQIRKELSKLDIKEFGM